MPACAQKLLIVTIERRMPIMHPRHLSSKQREVIGSLVQYYLGQRGKTIKEIGTKIPGDDTQAQYGNSPIWHRKKDLDEYIAHELHLPATLWGPKRISNELMKRSFQELEKLRKKGMVKDEQIQERRHISTSKYITCTVKAPYEH